MEAFARIKTCRHLNPKCGAYLCSAYFLLQSCIRGGVGVAMMFESFGAEEERILMDLTSFSEPFILSAMLDIGLSMMLFMGVYTEYRNFILTWIIVTASTSMYGMCICIVGTAITLVKNVCPFQIFSILGLVLYVSTNMAIMSIVIVLILSVVNVYPLLVVLRYYLTMETNQDEPKPKHKLQAQ